MKVLVIGGASGLGLALVEIALARGYQVTVLDLDSQTQKTRLADATFVFCDIASQESVGAALAMISHRAPFDLVIFTAGISTVGRFEELVPSQMLDVLAVNLTGTMAVTQAMVSSGMLARGGRLVLTSSLSHYVGYPGASVYAASKDGIVVFGKSITDEMKRKYAIKVQIIAPGPMDTSHAERHAPPGSRRDRRVKPEVVAVSILDRRRAGLFVPGLAPRLFAVLGRFFPGLVGHAMMKAIYRQLP